MFKFFLKKFPFSLVILFNGFLVSTCFCDSQVREEPSERRHHIGFGPDFLVYKWNEDVKSLKSKGSQLLGGNRLRYEYRAPNLFYLGFDTAYFRVVKDYKICNNVPRSGDSCCASRDLTYLDLRLGYTFSNGSRDYLISPFLGVGGFAFLYDRQCCCNTRSKEDFLLYVSGGMNVKYHLIDRLDLGCGLKVLYLSSEKVRFNLQDEKIKEEKNLWGGECSLSIVWHMSQTKRWDVGLEPYVVALGFAKEQVVFGTRLLFEYNF